MEKIEELFKKVNKEKILIKGHKDGLKRYLLDTEYFNEKSFDYKPALAAAFFSLIALSTFLFNDNNPSEVALENDLTVSEVQPQVFNESMKMMSVADEAPMKESVSLYDKLIAKDTAKASESVLDEKEVNVIEVFEDNIKTRYYFNKDKNILIKTEIINNNK